MKFYERMLSIGIILMVVSIYPINATNPRNYIVNGGFEDPKVHTWKSFHGGVTGWKANEIEIGKGNIYNKNWGSNTQVAELDSNKNQYYTQKIDLQQGKYSLELDYAARQGASLGSSSMSIFWNGEQIKFIHSANYNVNHFSQSVKANRGVNTLQIRGEGNSDSLGMTIDNVALTFVEDQGRNKNFIVNGGFQDPRVDTWKSFHGGVTGWKANEIEIGKGNIYNKNWGSNTQVAELDSNKNQYYTQKIDLQQGKYSLELDYAARQGASLGSSSMSIFWNGEQIKFIHSTNYNVNHFSRSVKANRGVNTLQIRGEGNSDSLGMTIDNVALTFVEDLRSEVTTYTETISLRKGNYDIGFNYKWGFKSSTSYLKIYWNNEQIAKLYSKSTNTEHFNGSVKGLEGKNVLLIQAFGEDGGNVSIDAIQLRRNDY